MEEEVTCDVIQGDCVAVLRERFTDESVQCCVTSPPYWGLRDYGVAGQLGLEKTPEEYVAKMVEVFREVKRVLKADGTLWLNLGDSYATGTTAGRQIGTLDFGQGTMKARQVDRCGTPDGLKTKDLCGIPWRVAFALQADGWYLRSDIIWHKPNPMPESVTDRPTKSHEYLFLFAKGQWVSRIVKFANVCNERFHLGQHISAEKTTIGEPFTKFCIALSSALFDASQSQYNFSLPPFYSEIWEQGSQGFNGQNVCDHPGIWTLASISARFLSANTTTKEFIEQLNSFRLNLGTGQHFLKGWIHALPLPPSIHSDANGTITVHDSGEICEFEFCHDRIVLKSPTTCKYYYDADAIREDVTSIDKRAGRNSQCLVDRSPNPRKGMRSSDPETFGLTRGKTNESCSHPLGRNKRSVWTVATQPYSEAHFATFPPKLIEPCILAGCPSGGLVLDPFAGSGTTLAVAQQLGRRAIGIELNSEYIALIHNRIKQKALPL